jgi:transposase-like protein
VILAAIAEAQLQGARMAQACRVVGISARTVERWRARPEGGVASTMSILRARPSFVISKAMSMCPNESEGAADSMGYALAGNESVSLIGASGANSSSIEARATAFRSSSSYAW